MRHPLFILATSKDPCFNISKWDSGFIVPKLESPSNQTMTTRHGQLISEIMFQQKLTDNSGSKTWEYSSIHESGNIPIFQSIKNCFAKLKWLFIGIKFMLRKHMHEIYIWQIYFPHILLCRSPVQCWIENSIKYNCEDVLNNQDMQIKIE